MLAKPYTISKNLLNNHHFMVLTAIMSKKCCLFDLTIPHKTKHKPPIVFVLVN